MAQSAQGSAGVVVGLRHLRGLFQPEQFYGSVILWLEIELVLKLDSIGLESHGVCECQHHSSSLPADGVYCPWLSRHLLY